MVVLAVPWWCWSQVVVNPMTNFTLRIVTVLTDCSMQEEESLGDIQDNTWLDERRDFLCRM